MAVGANALAAGELQSLNPATLEVVGSVRIAAAEEIAEQVAEARLVAEKWCRTDSGERRALLARVGHVILRHADELATTITAETGKPLVEAYTADLLVSLDNAGWLAANAGRVLRPERVPFRQPYVLHKRGRLVHEPLGAVAIIAPWNFPFGIPFTETATAVAAGNAVLLKPSELTPLSGAWVERIFDEAGAPKGLVRALQGYGETVGSALVRARGVAKVFFTGSAAVGRDVASAAGERLRPVVLELGGKDPMLVLEDADLERAVEGALWGSFSNCGQVCAGVERIYVARPRFEAFVEELAGRARSLRLGSGADPAVELGPLISEEQRVRAERLVADALDRGAEARTGGHRPDLALPGWFYEPTVIAGAPHDAAIMREEIFGPVVTVAPFDGEDEAVRLANDSPFGLGASVWTRDLERYRRIARGLEAGMVWMNDVAYSYGTGQASWGGVKGSGFGRTHSKHGLYECSRVKFVDEDRGRVPVPWWFPYRPEALDGFRGMLGLLFESGLEAKAGAAWRHRRGLVHLGARYLGVR